MAERRASLMQPRVEDLMDRVDSKFTLVTLAAMRAREINDYYNQLGEGLGRIVPPQVTSVSRKPLSIALEEIDAGKILFERIVEVPEDPRTARRRPIRPRARTPRLDAAGAEPTATSASMTNEERKPRVVLGICGGHRRVQGGRGVPAGSSTRASTSRRC